jgi:hypothetical protein
MRNKKTQINQQYTATDNDNINFDDIWFDSIQFDLI